MTDEEFEKFKESVRLNEQSWRNLDETVRIRQEIIDGYSRSLSRVLDLMEEYYGYPECGLSYADIRKWLNLPEGDKS